LLTGDTAVDVDIMFAFFSACCVVFALLNLWQWTYYTYMS